MLRILSLVCALLLLVTQTKALTLAPPEYIATPNDIVWIASASDLIITCWGDGLITTWDVDSLNLVSQYRLPDYRYSLCSTEISCNKDPLLAVVKETAVADWGSTIQLWSLREGKLLRNVRMDRLLRPVGFSVDGLMLGLEDDGQCQVIAIETSTGKTKWTVQDPDIHAHQRELLPDGSGFVHCDLDNVIAYNHSGQPVWKREFKRRADSFWRSPHSTDGVCVWLVDPDEQQCLSVSSGRTLWSIAIPQNAKLLASAPDGKLFVTQEADKVVIHRPNQQPVVVAGLVGHYDPMIASGGRIICLPAIAAFNSSDYAAKIPMVRPSLRLTIHDSTTGLLLKARDLHRPAAPTSSAAK